jgi:ribosomal protein S18 acetylase RimI-like enzyme
MDSPSALSLRPALPPDEGFLLELYASTRSDEMAACGWPLDQQQAFLRQQYATRRAAYQTSFPGAMQSIVNWGGAKIGAITVHHTEGEIRLVDLALTPAHRGKGMGRTLMEGVLAEARSAGKPVKLHVLKNNAAQRLYRRLGFVVTGTKGEYIAMTWRGDSENEIRRKKAASP